MIRVRFTYFDIDRDNETEKQRAAQSFWLKYWVCFAYYYVLEFILDCVISWLPLYNEVSPSPIGESGSRSWSYVTLLSKVKIARFGHGIANYAVCRHSRLCRRAN